MFIRSHVGINCLYSQLSPCRNVSFTDKNKQQYFYGLQRGKMYHVFSGIEEHDNEGRVITAEFKEFYLVASCE